MYKLLQDFSRCTKGDAILNCVIEETSGRFSQGVQTTYCVHHDIGINESHVAASPVFRDVRITARCSSHSGSFSGPSCVSHS